MVTLNTAIGPADNETILGPLPPPATLAVQPAPVVVEPTEPPDFTDKYNTKLSPADEEKFQAAMKENPKLARDLADYDVRGWWKQGAATAENGHGTDEFKKPNHPTFSDESKYHGVDGNQGGHWVEDNGKFSYEASPTNLKNYGQGGLADYFKRVEPDIQLIIPTNK